MPETPAEFAGRVALVTGAASGIGRASARALAAAGASVVVSDIDTERGEAVAAALRQSGAQALFVRTNVSQGEDVQRLVDVAVSTFGRLDFAHNNAGAETPLAAVADSEEDAWDRSIAVNLTGVWRCMRAEIRQMLAQGGGVIVNTASQGGLRAVPQNAAYCAAKHGVIGLTRTAAAEYAAANIRINAICPGLTRTSMTERLEQADPVRLATQFSPMGRMGTVEEIAATVVFLCSAGASFITGHALSIDGGATAI